MSERTVYERVEGKRGVRVTRDEWGMNLLTMRNGFQWSGAPVDRDLLLMIRDAVEAALAED